MFEWDARKAAVNRTKYGSRSRRRRACSAIRMPWMARIFATPRMSRGRAATGRVLIVAYTVRRGVDGEKIRIISARRASRKERAGYSAAQD
jgi:uncharacterized DUF497 family protein